MIKADFYNSFQTEQNNKFLLYFSWPYLSINSPELACVNLGKQTWQARVFPADARSLTGSALQAVTVFDERVQFLTE
jgi:hypothetical protein